jgi:cytochrome b6-f complex iron-sulfur subunit
MIDPNSQGEAEPMTRRHFLDAALWLGGVALVASVAYPVAKYLVPPPQAEANPSSVDVGKEEDFQPDTGTIFKMGNKPGILVRSRDGQFHAFIAVCTHLGCTVQYRPDLGLIWCACHSGRFDLNGINIAGPPPRPLTPLAVNIRDGQVFVSREEA